MTDDELSRKAAIRRAVGGVLFNVSNFPERAQSRLWGANMGPLNERITDEVVAVVEKAIAKAQAEAIREATDALDTEFQDIPAWREAYVEGVRTDDWMRGGSRMVVSAIDVLKARADRIEAGQADD